MPCQPKQPTGEKAPPRFQAPAYYPTDKPVEMQRVLQQAFSSVQNAIEGLSSQVATPPATQALTAVAGTIMANAGDVLRLLPGPSGIKVVLPTARSANKGKEVSLILQGSGGPVSVTAVSSQVQGQPISTPVVLTGQGLRVFRSDGGDGNAPGGWWIVGRNSTDATGALQAISAGTQLASSGTVAFSNSNGVTFGLSGSSLLTASVAPIGLSILSLVTLAGSQAQSITNATDSSASGNTLFLPFMGTNFNSSFSFNNVSWRLSGNTLLADAQISFIASTFNRGFQILSLRDLNGITWGMDSTTFAGFGAIGRITGNYAAPRAISAGTTLASDGTIVFSNSNNVSFGLNGSTVTGSIATSLTAINVSAGTTSNLLSAITFADGANIVFGLNGSIITASAVNPQILLSHIGGNSKSVSRIVLSDANGVSFGVGTDVIAGRATITASVATSLTNINVSAGTTSNLLSALVFSNSNGISFGLNGSTVTASHATSLTAINVSAGTTSQNLSALVFSNSNGVSFGLNGSTITATVVAGAAAGIAAISANGGGASQQTSGTVIFANSNNFTFGLTSNSMTASFSSVPGAVRANAGADLVLGTIAFSNSNGVTFGRNASTITASIDQALVQVAAGASAINNSASLSFADSNGVTFGLSTNAGGVMRLTASVASVATSLTNIRVSAGTTSNLLSALTFSDSNNVSFGLNGSVITATATVATSLTNIRISAGTTSNLLSAITFSNSNGVSFGLNGSTLTASVGGAAAGSISAGTTSVALGQVVFSNSNGISFGLNGSTVTAAAGPVMSYWNNFAGNSGSGLIAEGLDVYWGTGSAAASMPILPLTPGWAAHWGFPGNMTLGTLAIPMAGSCASSNTNTGAITLRGGLYTMVNSTQLSLLNSFSSSFSQTTAASGARVNSFNSERQWTVHSSQWSSQPVLVFGSQYWLGLVFQLNNGNAAFSLGVRAQQIPYVQSYVGGVGVSATALSGAPYPFWGLVNTTNVPNSIGTANLITGNGALNVKLSPVVAFYNGIQTA